jgi:hypothetical protein
VKKSHKNELLPTIFQTKLQRSDPRVVNAMAKYAVGKNLTFGAAGSAKSINGDSKNIQISSKKSARLLATAIYYSLKQVCIRVYHGVVASELFCCCVSRLYSTQLV